ncbi:MAG: YceI family protein [Myxococcota bacterium]
MRNVRSLGVVLGLTVSVGGGTAWAADYKVDPAKSSLVVQTFIGGMAGSLGHDHIVNATDYSGTIKFDPAAPDGTAVNVEVKTASLKADVPEVRKRFGYEKGPNEKDRAEIESNMRAENQLHTSKYPTMSFVSTKVTKQGEGQFLVAGKLTIRGVTKDVSFPAKVVVEGNTVRGTGQLKFNQSSFGYSPYSAALGALKNKDEVVLHLDLVGVTDAAAAAPPPAATPVQATPAAQPAQPAPAKK